MKVERHGQAKILNQNEINLIFSEGLTNSRDRALFALCLYTACRINECVTLRTSDVYYRKGEVRPEVILRKGNTKGKLGTRCIPVIEELRRVLLNYYPEPLRWYYFPGKGHRGHLQADSASRIFRKACQKVGIQGASTHSFRRTALTMMSNEGIPLRIIQEVSGHRNLEQLQKYLEIQPDQVLGAVSALSMLSPVTTNSSSSSNKESRQENQPV